MAAAATAVLAVLFLGGQERAADATHIVNVNKVYISNRCDDKPGFINQFFSGVPTDPRPDQDSMGTCNGVGQHNWYVTAEYSVSTTRWLYLGVWDAGRGIWVADEMIERSPGSYTFFSTVAGDWDEFKNLSECLPTGADFTRCADSYQFYAYYWTASQWIQDDSATGLIVADWDWTGDDCCHFNWSPNSYARPSKSSPYSQNGRSYVDLQWKMAYYDGMNVGGATVQGTARLNRLKGWAGSFQVEFRRDTDGWDAANIQYDLGWCTLTEIWPWYSNIPGFSVDFEQVEETHSLGGTPCNGTNNEEAQGKSSSEASWNATFLSDASNAMNVGYWYYKQAFSRRTANQGQQFRLQTEFELNEDTGYPGWDFSFDVVVATQRAETY